MIELRQISFAHDGHPPVLDRVDLEFADSELLLLTGPTGSGKSTLLGVIAGLVPRFSGGTLSGDLLLDGASILRLPPRERAEHIGYVGQDPVAGFVTDTVEEELAYGMEQLGLAPATMRRRVEETLDLLGIADLRHRSLRTLSGGQQQRVAIGSVLTMHPRFLVLDEPTSALDPTAAEDVLATLTRLVQDLGTSVLLAEHRLERVIPFADRIALMPGDGTVQVGSPAEVLASSPIAPPLVDLGRALGWHPLPLTVRDARAVARAQGLGDLAAPAAVEPRTGATALAARRIEVSHGRNRVLDGVDLTLQTGTVTALMGRNGAGKSTLLWALQGGGPRSSGRVETDAGDPKDLKPDQRRHAVGLLPQTAADLLYLDTVQAECDAGGSRTREVLDALVPGIDPDRHPRDLSEGQRLAVALSLVLVSDPGVILLDEPTRGLDYTAKGHLAEILAGLAAQGRAIMVATHDVEFTAMVADRVIVLAEGEVVSDGPAAEVVAQSPAFAPQVTKVMGPGWTRVSQVTEAVISR